MVAPITPGALKTPDNPDGVDTAALEKAGEALCKDRPHVIAAAAPAFFAPKNPVSAEMMQWVDRHASSVLHEGAPPASSCFHDHGFASTCKPFPSPL
jgi:hypothetical protein